MQALPKQTLMCATRVRSLRKTGDSLAALKHPECNLPLREYEKANGILQTFKGVFLVLDDAHVNLGVRKTDQITEITELPAT